MIHQYKILTHQCKQPVIQFFFKLPFITVPNNIKYQDIGITKYVQNFYVENYKTLMKKIRNLNKDTLLID